MVLFERAGAVSAPAAATKSAAAHSGRNDLDRRRADRRAMHCRAERLASAGPHPGQNLSVAPYPDLPARAGRSRDVFRHRSQDLCRAGPCRGSRRNHRRVDPLMSKLVISSIGPASSVQDGGRPGSQRYGLTPGGASDRLALAVANTLVGNKTFAAAVEIGPFGASFTAREGAVRVGLAGARRDADIAKRPVTFDSSVTLADGETLTLGFARGADVGCPAACGSGKTLARVSPRGASLSNLGVEGSMEGEPMFGSLSVNAR